MNGDPYAMSEMQRRIRGNRPWAVRFIILHVCPKCEGAWFDKGQLDALDDSVWTNVEKLHFDDVSDAHQDLECPKCKKDMKPLSPHDAKEIVIDRCQECAGFWLDKGELDQMRAVAGHEEAKQLDHVVYLERPNDCSVLKWVMQCFKDCYFKKQ